MQCICKSKWKERSGRPGKGLGTCPGAPRSHFLSRSRGSGEVNNRARWACLDRRPGSGRPWTGLSRSTHFCRWHWIQWEEELHVAQTSFLQLAQTFMLCFQALFALVCPPAPAPCAIHYGSLAEDFEHMLALMEDSNSDTLFRHRGDSDVLWRSACSARTSRSWRACRSPSSSAQTCAWAWLFTPVCIRHACYGLPACRVPRLRMARGGTRPDRHPPARDNSRAVDRKFVRASAAARPPRWLGARLVFSYGTPLRRQDI
jgi:hypothetical protein